MTISYEVRKAVVLLKYSSFFDKICNYSEPCKLRSANACIQADKQFYKEIDKNKKGRVFYGIFNRKDSNHHRWRKGGIE